MQKLAMFLGVLFVSAFLVVGNAMALTEVPEPATMSLLGAGLVGLAVVSIKRIKK